MFVAFFSIADEASGICRPWDGINTIHNLTGSSGTLFSPDYPAHYPVNVRCVWIISVPAGKRVKVKFEDLELKNPLKSCKQQSIHMIDNVQIGDGKDPESKGLALFCGHETSNPDVYSTGRYMWVKFFSNQPKTWMREKDFKARFEAVDQRKYFHDSG